MWIQTLTYCSLGKWQPFWMNNFEIMFIINIKSISIDDVFVSFIIIQKSYPLDLDDKNVNNSSKWWLWCNKYHPFHCHFFHHKIREKFLFICLIKILIKQLLQNFAYHMTAMLSWHVKSLLWSDNKKLNHCKMQFPWNLNCKWKIFSQMAPKITFPCLCH